MPTYEYECEHGHVTEQFHTISTYPETIKCPKCGKNAKKLLGKGQSIIFKGSWPGKDIQKQREVQKDL